MDSERRWIERSKSESGMKRGLKEKEEDTEQLYIIQNDGFGKKMD
jgi:hypothetical protein